MSNSTKTIGIIAVMLFIASIAVLFAIMYLIRSGEADLLSLQQEISNRNARERELVSLIELVEHSETERAELTTYILKDAEVVEFLALIETLGREQGVTLTTTSLNEVNIGEAFTTVEITTSVQGNYAALEHLLALFEALPYQSLITDFNLTRDTSGADSWSGSFNLRVTKYSKL